MEKRKRSAGTSLDEELEAPSDTYGFSKYKPWFQSIIQDGEKQAMCKICKEKKVKKYIKMKNYNTSGLKKHLQTCHNHIVSWGKKTETQTTSGRRKTGFNQAEFDKMIVKWVSLKYLPFNYFDDDYTQEFFGLLNREISIPSEHELRDKVISEFERVRKNLADILQNNKSKISFTVDGWTSVANQHFYRIAAHYIDDNWTLQSVVIDFVASSDKHTGKDIAETLYETISSHDIKNKLQGITADKKALSTGFKKILIDEMEKQGAKFDPETQYFESFAHILNEWAEDMLKAVSVEESSEENNDRHIDCDDYSSTSQKSAEQACITKIRTIFKEMKRCEKFKNKSKSCYCEIAGAKFMLPNLDVSGYWISTYDMLQTAQNLKDVLPFLSKNTTDLDSDNFIISEREWALILKVTEILKVFKEVSSELNRVTLSEVIVLHNKLLTKIEERIQELDKEIKYKALSDSFKKGRDEMVLQFSKPSWLYCASLICDPRHKETLDVSDWGKEMKRLSLETFKNILKEYCTNCNAEATNDRDDFNINSSKYCKPNEYRGWEEEYENYMKIPKVSKSMDIFDWWKLHSDTYPNLARIAKDILSIPAASIPCDWLFSAETSLAIKKHRNALNEDSARSILCLNSWYTSSLSDMLLKFSTSS